MASSKKPAAKKSIPAKKAPVKRAPAKKAIPKTVGRLEQPAQIAQADEPSEMDGLRPKQIAFIFEYLIDQNATQAAIRAGYSPKTAYSIGAENLSKPQIASILAKKQAEIDARRTETLNQMELTEARVLRETARLAFFDPRKLFDAKGNPIPFCDLDDDTAAAIAGVDVLEEYEGKGEDRVLVGHIKKYKVADKNTSLERAAKILGLLKKDNEQAGNAAANALTALLQGMGKSALPVVRDPAP